MCKIIPDNLILFLFFISHMWNLSYQVKILSSAVKISKYNFASGQYFIYNFKSCRPINPTSAPLFGVFWSLYKFKKLFLNNFSDSPSYMIHILSLSWVLAWFNIRGEGCKTTSILRLWMSEQKSDRWILNMDVSISFAKIISIRCTVKISNTSHCCTVKIKYSNKTNKISVLTQSH